jgi:hypothetical protein
MQPALHISTKVLPGNKIEISTPELPVGNAVEVFVIIKNTSSPQPPLCHRPIR